MDVKHGLYHLIEKYVIAIDLRRSTNALEAGDLTDTYLLEELHILAAKAGLRKFGKLVARCWVMKYDLEDFCAEEVGQL